MSLKIEDINMKYKNYNFIVIDNIENVYIKDNKCNFDINCKDYNECLNDIKRIFSKVLKDKELKLILFEQNKWKVESMKLDFLFTKDRERVAIKQDNSYLLVHKCLVPFLEELEQLDFTVQKDGKEYCVYQAVTNSLKKKIEDLKIFQYKCFEIEEISFDEISI